MTEVTLQGRLHCRDLAQSELIAALLPRHAELTLAEPGCLRFDVTPSDDPLIWFVEERFCDPASYHAHQARVAASHWGRATGEVVRRYTVTGLESPQETASA